jgi:hypothetical protein
MVGALKHFVLRLSFHRKSALAAASVELIDGKRLELFRYGQSKNPLALASSILGEQTGRSLQQIYVPNVSWKLKTSPTKYGRNFG